MIPKSLAQYFYFGTCVRYLQDAREGIPLHDKVAGQGHVLYTLDAFFRFLKALNLRVTIRASEKVSGLFREFNKMDENATLSKEQAASLSDAMNKLRETLQAELEGFEAYVVTPKRIPVERLLANVPSLLPPGVFDKLPELARYDLGEGGKCIAFERPTAAAFHILRASEGVLREFYCHHVKRGRVELMWNPMIQSIRSKRRFEDDEDHMILFDHLDHIRDSFRNPTQHPDKIYDIQEVQELWSLCVDAITRMAKDLPAVSPVSIQST